MPTRLHRPMHEGTPTILDRVLAHPWELGVVSGVWATMGALLCWTWIIPGDGPTTVLTTLGPALAAGVAVALLISGLLVLAAVAWPGKDSTAWRIELFALPLGISAWLAYAIVTPSIWWQVVALGYVVAGSIRLVAAWLNMRRPVQTVLVLVEE